MRGNVSITGVVTLGCLWVASLPSCGGSDAGAEGAAGGTTSGGNAGTSGDSSANSGGADASQGGAGTSGGSAGEGELGGSHSGGSGGAPSKDDACGGDVSGEWAMFEPSHPVPAVPDFVDACWNLALARFGDMLSASTWVNGGAAQAHTLIWSFRTDESLATRWQMSRILEGPVTQHYSPECLSMGDVQVSCGELDMPLRMAGANDGSWSGVTCVDAAEGGCDCTFDVVFVMADYGSWSVMDGGITLTVTDYPMDDVISSTYCIEDKKLRFGPEIDALVPWTEPGWELGRTNCTDGLRGPTEAGPDCGRVCDNSCP